MDTAYQPRSESQVTGARSVPMVMFEPILDPVQHQHQLLAPLLDQQITMPSCQGVPIQVDAECRVVWLLHLYSGRRRIGDCHWWLEHIGA